MGILMFTASLAYQVKDLGLGAPTARPFTLENLDRASSLPRRRWQFWRRSAGASCAAILDLTGVSDLVVGDKEDEPGGVRDFAAREWQALVSKLEHNVGAGYPWKWPDDTPGIAFARVLETLNALVIPGMKAAPFLIGPIAVVPLCDLFAFRDWTCKTLRIPAEHAEDGYYSETDSNEYNALLYNLQLLDSVGGEAEDQRLPLGIWG